MKKKKEGSKLTICTFNPSKRKMESVTLEEIYTGILRYTDGSFECLVGLESEALKTKNILNKKALHVNHRRRLTGLQWSVHRSHTVGDDVKLSPRSIAIAWALIRYLRAKGFVIP